MRDEVPEALDGETLAARLGVTSRALRTWVAAGLLPRPPAHGQNTKYPRASIVIAYAIRALRKEKVSIPQVKKHLRGKTDAELRELGGLPPAPPGGTRPPALPRTPPTPRLAANATPPPDAPLAPPEVVPKEDRLTVQDGLARSEPRAESGVPIGTEWRRIELLPGLELHVRADASPFAHGLAAAIASGRFTKP